MADFNTLLAVRDLMKPEIVTANKNVNIHEAAKIMLDRGVSSIVMTDDNGHIAGILTETEIVRKVVAAGLEPNSTKTEQVMNPDVHRINGDTSIFDARHKMAELGVKHLVVELAGKPVGLISSTALLGA